MRSRIVLAVLMLCVIAGSARAATLAWTFANNPIAPAYAANPQFTHNPSGAAVNITRGPAGNYSVRFVNLAPLAQRGVAQVTTVGPTTTTCRPTGFGPQGTDVMVFVRCQSPAGVLTDARFTVLYTAN